MTRPSLLLALACCLPWAGCTLDGFLFNPRQQDGPYDLSGTTIPADRFDEEGTFVSAEDGTRIHLYYIKASGKHPARAKTAIFYCHGNSTNIGHYWWRMEAIHELGYQVLIFDYRGYGRSEGKPDEPGLYMDAEAALAHLLKQPAVDARRVAFYGHSLGAAVCIELATRKTVDAALVVESPFRSVKDLVQDGAIASLPPSFVTSHGFDNFAKIDKVGAPLLVMHGLDDDFLMSEYGQALYDQAQQPKTLWLVPGAAHSDIPDDPGTPRRKQWADKVTAHVDGHVK
jgi:fermentation-respiration switch protein FrsA (DUF1100 family)